MEILKEFNRNDKNLIESIGETFTISLEIELETNDTNSKISEFFKLQYNTNENLFKEFSIKDVKDYIEENNLKNNLLNIAKQLISELELDDDKDDDYNMDIFDEYKSIHNKKHEKEIIDIVLSSYLTYLKSDNIEYLISKVKENLPNFYKKWNNILKFELDNTLKRGIEFSPKKYLNGINKAIEMIKDFYNDFNSQKYWYMSKRTGIHINIGIDNKKNWNVLKGFLLISDFKENSYVFKNMEWRKKSFYAKSFLPDLKKNIETDREQILKHSDFLKLKDIENNMSNYIVSNLKKHGYKNYGFNVTRIEKLNYVEFRYPGGEVSEKTLIDKMYYFCYLVHLMTDDNYKRKDYLKKLYKFISSI